MILNTIQYITMMAIILLTFTFSTFHPEESSRMVASTSTNDDEIDLLLEAENTILLKGDIDEVMADDIIAQLVELSLKLPLNETINLVIDSQGGNVSDGMRIIAVMESITQKINTTAMLAFSMAFSIFQRGDKRYISTFGLIGQHRGRNTYNGQFGKGEVESALDRDIQMVSILSEYEAGRMGITHEEFKALIHDEMWLMRKKAIQLKAADKVVRIICSETLLKGKVVRSSKNPNMFSNDKVTRAIPACPLLK